MPWANSLPQTTGVANLVLKSVANLEGGQLVVHVPAELCICIGWPNGPCDMDSESKDNLGIISQTFLGKISISTKTRDYALVSLYVIMYICFRIITGVD